MTFPENLSNTHKHVGTEEVEDDAALSRCPGEEAAFGHARSPRKAPGECRHHCPPVEGSRLSRAPVFLEDWFTKGHWGRGPGAPTPALIIDKSLIVDRSPCGT